MKNAVAAGYVGSVTSVAGSGAVLGEGAGEGAVHTSRPVKAVVVEERRNASGSAVVRKETRYLRTKCPPRLNNSPSTAVE